MRIELCVCVCVCVCAFTFSFPSPAMFCLAASSGCQVLFFVLSIGLSAILS